MSSSVSNHDKVLTIAVYALVLLAAIVLHVLAPSVIPVSIWDGNLVGADAYMQLVRLKEFIEVGDWYHDTVTRSNAPYGETIYWTHAFQFVLLVLSGLLWPFLEYPANVHWAGVLVSPILHVILVFVSAWAAKPILGRYRFWVMPIVLVQSPILSQATLGRADHHVLLFLIFTIAVGLVLRLLIAPSNRKLAVITGAVHGIALWISVEHILLIAVTLGFGGLWWIFSNRSAEGRHQIARLNLEICVGLVAAVVLALIIERPVRSLPDPDVDLISVAYLFSLILAAIFWLILNWFTKSREIPFGAPGRIAVSAVGGGLLLAIMYLVYPSFFGGPLVHASPIVQSVLLDVVADMQPFHAFPLRMVLVMYGSAAIAIPALFWLVYRERTNRSIIAWLYLSAGMALYVFVAAKHVRFLPYVSCLGAIPLAFLFDTIRRYSEQNLKRLAGIVVRTTAALLIFLGPGFVFPIMNFSSNAKVSTYADTLSICLIQEISAILNAFPGEQIILVPYIYAGPEIMYFTRHSVVGTPYQRNIEGIEDTFRFMTSTDDAEARRIIDKRGIGLVLMCDDRQLQNFYAGETDKETLYTRLRRGQAPDWLQRIDLPKSIEDTFTLYRVRKTSGT